MLDWESLLSPDGPHFHFTTEPLPPVPATADGLQLVRAALPDEATLSAGAAANLVLATLERAFELPGRLADLDAFVEVLRERAPLALVVELSNVRGLFRAAPAVAGALLHTWATVADERRAEGVAMHLVGRW